MISLVGGNPQYHSEIFFYCAYALSSTPSSQIIPFFSFLDPIVSSFIYREKKQKVRLSLIMSKRKFKLPCHCVLSDCQHSQRLWRSTAESHCHAQQQRDDHHYWRNTEEKKLSQTSITQFNSSGSKVERLLEKIHSTRGEHCLELLI